MMTTLPQPGSWIRGLIFGLAVATAVLPVPADQEAARIPIVDAPPGTPGIGGGLRLGSNPFRGDSSKVDLIPLYLYEGKYLFAHGVSAGIHIYRNKKFSLDLFGQYRFTRLDVDDDPYFEGLEDRKQTFEAGIALNYKGNWGAVRLDWAADIMDRHNGQTASLSYRYFVDRGNWSYSPYVSVSWKDKDFTRYYFGIAGDEELPGRPAYTPGEAFNLGYGLNTSYQWSERILLFGNIGFEHFDSEIADSPLVEEGMTSAGFVGASFMFGNVGRAETPRVERENEWSWRVNYGYQADGNIIGDIDQGEFRKSTWADTNIGGITLSKLLIDNPRLDWYGRAAVYRHFEKPLQDNFFSFAAYIMTMGRGRMPWSDQTVFRYGFGFGLSYAQEVPIVEQLKQGARDRNYQQFLNYLELTLDFPVDRDRSTKLWKDCYTGVTVVHRSGIFSASDMLGNVFGGSDWITLHLECLR